MVGWVVSSVRSVSFTFSGILLEGCSDCSECPATATATATARLTVTATRTPQLASGLPEEKHVTTYNVVIKTIT